MKNILVPIGSSSSAVSTLQYAIDLAKQFEAYVYVISVFQEFSKVGGLTKVNTILKEDSENNLERVISEVDKKGVTLISHPIKGEIVETIKRFDEHVRVDLMVLSPRSNSIRDEVFLGNTTGKLIKQTNIPALIVPENGTFQKPEKILMAFKNGYFEKKKVLEPLRTIAKKFDSTINVLHVETPDSSDDMLVVSKNVKDISTGYKKVENATTFQAVLEHFQQNSPDMLCVVRRPRGFFKKLWEKNTILKKEFHTSKPLLILRVQK